jgi:hypothetical protein
LDPQLSGFDDGLANMLRKTITSPTSQHDGVGRMSIVIHAGRNTNPTLYPK